MPKHVVADLLVPEDELVLVPHGLLHALGLHWFLIGVGCLDLWLSLVDLSQSFVEAVVLFLDEVALYAVRGQLVVVAALPLEPLLGAH